MAISEFIDNIARIKALTDKFAAARDLVIMRESRLQKAKQDYAKAEDELVAALREHQRLVSEMIAAHDGESPRAIRLSDDEPDDDDIKF